MKNKLLLLLLAATLAACGGGSGTPTPTPNDPPAASITTTTSNTVIADATQTAQVISTSSNTDNSTTLNISAAGNLVSDLTVGKILHIPAGDDTRYPLGLSAKVDSISTNTDGTKAVKLSPATLADIAQKSVSSFTDIPLSADNFVGVVAPKAVYAGTPATIVKGSSFKSKTLAPWSDGVTALNGGLILRSAKTNAALNKAESIFGGNGVLQPSAIQIKPTTIDLGAFSKDQTNKLSPYSADGKAQLTYQFDFKNLKITQNHDIEKIGALPTKLNSLTFKVEGDMSANIAITGDAKGELGYFAPGAWREVEEEVFKITGATATLLGLSSKDKVGKYPIAGLVFSVACPPTGCPVKAGASQTPLRAAKPLGVIVWVYVNAKGNIGFTGEIGINLAESHLALGVQKPEGGSLSGIHSLTNNGSSRMIKAPYIKGEVDLNLRLGVAVDVDFFAFGVRLGNASADVVGNVHTKINSPTEFSYGTQQLGSGTPWAWEGDACVNTSLGAGLIVGARVNVGANIETVFGDKNIDPFEYSTQLPSEDEIATRGPKWSGILDKTWYTAEPLGYCFPKPVVTSLAPSQTRDGVTGVTTQTFTIFGTHLPIDLVLSITPASACTPVTKGSSTATKVVFSCPVSATGFGTPITSALSSVMARNLDASAIGSAASTIAGVKSIICTSPAGSAPVINQLMACTVTGGGFPRVSATEHLAATSTACSNLSESDPATNYASVRTFSCTPTAFGNQTVTFVWDKLGAAIAQSVTIAASTTSAAITLAAGSDTGTSSTDGITSNARPTLTGSAPAGATVTIKGNNGATIGTVVVPASGNWSLTPTSNLASGSNSLTYTVTQNGVTTSPSAAATIVIDATAPAKPTIANAVRQAAGTVVASGTAEANALITIAWPGGATQVVTASTTGAWTVTSSAVYAVGASVSAVASDAAGNISPSATATITATPAPTTGLLPDTGITAAQCYGAGSNALVSCASTTLTGQDGQTGRDVTTSNSADGKLGFSYSAVGNYPPTDCVQDNITGLMWEGKPAAGTLRGSPALSTSGGYTHYDANSGHTAAQIAAASNAEAYVVAVNAANHCGFRNWRLPTAGELQSIVDYGVAYPGPTVDAVWFPNTQGYAYWTSSPYVGNSDVAWGVDFNYGGVGSSYRDSNYHVRLVRASQ